MASRIAKASGLVLGAVFGLTLPAVAQDAPPEKPGLTEPFQKAASCEPIIYNPLITDRHMEYARERWRDNPEKLSDEVFLRHWITENSHLFSSSLKLPDLTTHPLAGREIEIQLSASDALDQRGDSQAIKCVLPSRGYYNPINVDLAKIRGDLAEYTQKMMADEFFRTRYPEIVAVYNALLSAKRETIKNQQNLEKLEALQTRMAAAKTYEDVGTIIDEMWEVMMALEEDHKTEATRKLEEAQELFQDAFRNGFDQKTMKDFMEKALEAMEQALREELEKAKEAGDTERQKEIEDMLEQLEKMREAMENMDKLNPNDAWNMSEMMRQMQQMQQSPQNMSQQMQQMQQQMQQMAEQMMKQMMEQKTMKELQEMIEQQQRLNQDTELTEDERRQMLDALQKTLKDLTERAETERTDAERRLQERLTERETAGAAETKERLEALREQLKELSERLQQDTGTQRSAEEARHDDIERQLQELGTQPPSEAREARRRELERQQQENATNLRRLEEIEREIREALEKLESPNLDSEDTGKILQDLERAQQDLQRMQQQRESGPQDPGQREPGHQGPQRPPPQGGDEKQDGGQQTPSQSIDQMLEELERRQQELEGQQGQNAEETEALRKQLQRMSQMRQQLQELKQRLEQPNMSQEEIQRAMEELKKLQQELAEAKETDMSAIQQAMMQLIGQLDGRVDEVGAKEYVKESDARRSDKPDVAETHDANQRLVMRLSDELDTIRDDLVRRHQQKHPMTEDEAKRTIGRLGEIKAELDRLDPPDPNEQSKQQNPGQQGGQQGQQPPQQPNELMQMLQRLMQQQQQQQQMQQQMKQMMEQMMRQGQDLQQRQQQMQQRLEQMRRQLEQMGMSKEQIDQIMQQMQNAGEQLGQGKPGGAMPGQNKALEGMMQMQQQLTPKPGMGNGPGPGQGTNSPDGQFMGEPSARDQLHRDGELDPSLLQNDSRRIRDAIRGLLDKPDLPPSVRQYYEELIRRQTTPGG